MHKAEEVLYTSYKLLHYKTVVYTWFSALDLLVDILTVGIC